MKRIGQVAVIGLCAFAAMALGTAPTDNRDTSTDHTALQLAPLPAAGAIASFAADPVAHQQRATQQGPALLGTSSARIEDRVVVRDLRPVGLRIDRIDVAAPVVTAGAGDDGAMEVPEGIDEVAWYEFGPSPGQAGSAVLAAHVDMAGLGPGVFFELHSLEAGDHITVLFDDASEQTFAVFDAERYLKEDLDNDRIFAREGPPILTLVTCGGGFNPSLRRYDSNVVVYAEPIGAGATQ